MPVLPNGLFPKGKLTKIVKEGKVAETKTAIQKEDLVSLVWREDLYHARLRKGVPRGVKLDLENGTYTLEGEKFQIGEGRGNSCRGAGEPIGVYDRTNLVHLRKLVNDAELVIYNRMVPVSLDP